jgi:hypothetical protein
MRLIQTNRSKVELVLFKHEMDYARDAVVA